MEERTKAREKAAKIRRFLLNEQLSDVRVVGAVPKKGTAAGGGGTKTGSSSSTTATSSGKKTSDGAETKGSGSATGSTTAGSAASPGGTTAGTAAAGAAAATTARDAASMAAIASATAVDVGGFPKMIVAEDHVTQLSKETCQCCHLQEFLPHLLDWELCYSTKSNGYILANPVHAMHLSSQFADDILGPLSSTLKSSSSSTLPSSATTAPAASSSSSSASAAAATAGSARSSSQSQSQKQKQLQKQRSLTSAATSSHHVGHTAPHLVQQPLWYGEEQQRKSALSTEGIVESWCPLDGKSSVVHDDASVDKLDRLKTLPYYRPDIIASNKAAAAAAAAAAAKRKQQQQPSSRNSQASNKSKRSKASSTTTAAPRAAAAAAKAPISTATAPTTTTTQQKEIDTTAVTSSEVKPNDAEKKEDEEVDQKEAKPEPSNESDDKPSTSTVVSSDSATVDVKMDQEPTPDKDVELSMKKAKVEQPPSSSPSKDDDDEESKSDEMQVDDVDTKKEDNENMAVDGEGSKDGTPGTEPKPVPSASKNDADADTATSDKIGEKVVGEDSDPTSKDDEQKKKEEHEMNESTPMEVDKVEDAADPVPENTKSSPAPISSSELKTTMDTEEGSTKDEKDKIEKNDETEEHAEQNENDATEQKGEKDPAGTESSLETPADGKDNNQSALEQQKKDDDEAKEQAEHDANENEEKPEMVGSSTSVAVEKTGTDAVVQGKGTDEDEKVDVNPPASLHSKYDDDSEKLLGEETVPTSGDRKDSGDNNAQTSKDDVEPQVGKATDKSQKEESIDVSPSKDEVNETSEKAPSDSHQDESIDDKNETPSSQGASNDPVTVTSQTVQSTEKSTEQPASMGAVAAITSAPVAPTKASPSIQAPKLILPAKKSSDVRMIRLNAEEERIRLLRRTVKPKRVRAKKTSPTASASKDAPPSKKRKKEAENKAKVASGWHPSKVKMLNDAQEQEWLAASEFVNQTVEGWMNRFRQSQELYWRERKKVQQRYFGSTSTQSFYLDSDENQLTKRHPQNGRTFFGDELMQCLDCSFVGCGPSSICQGTRNEMMQHMLLSGHSFAVTCGERSQIFCIRCGDFVYHEVFEQERFRIKMSQQIPWMAWKPNPVVRSVDAFKFLKTQEHGIVWRGLIASYPPLVPKEHVLSAKLAVRRLSVLKGRINESWLLTNPGTLPLAASQCLKKPTEVCSVAAPIGLYNLGNTCYMSAILQCLIFCEPLQRYFLFEAGHSHHSCRVYRESDDAAQARSSKIDKDASATTKTIRKTKDTNAKGSLSTICLACEMDRFYLSYLGNTIGEDLNQVLADSCRNLIPPGISGIIPPTPKVNKASSSQKGSPMDIGDMITSSWKCGGMKHLAGYEQRDAHEFLSAFLAEIGRNIVKYRERVHKSITTIGDDNAFLPKEKKDDYDIINKLFQGSLRSVLLCEKCGVKRLQKEPFMDVSLSLSEEVERMQTGGKGQRDVVLDLQTCLEHFVLPEKLSDLVFCSSCGTRTPTKKQHTFSKLPKVLCLHLKRFDAARNQKIDQFVSFPAHNLNMGGFLPQWREVSRVPQGTSNNDSATAATRDGTTPLVLYDLFGTVNHIGSMSSGHYVSNVKVDGSWYHCNDQHVSRSTEGRVLKSSAYMLFYVRR